MTQRRSKANSRHEAGAAASVRSKAKTGSSLRRQLLRWLLPAMLLLLAAGALTAYSVALGSAIRAYDRALLDTAHALAGQIQANQGAVTLNLPKAAQEILLTDKYDQIFFRVLTADGREVAGDAALPAPPNVTPEENRLYYDAEIGGKPVRVAALFTERDGLPLIILAAETLVKRNNLVWEILLGMLLPELGLVLATLALVWIGIRSGLRPLDELRQQLARRSHSDLRPIVAEGLTEEIQPVVDELNQLLLRLDESLLAQRHFVSDAAHQLRTPIAALQTQVEVALREPEREARPQLEQILGAAQRLAHLVQQLLALARAEPKDGSADQAIDLAAVVREVAEIALPRAIAAGLDLGFDLSPTHVRGSRLLLQEALGNLIDNAIHYTPAPGSITVGCRATAYGAILSVEDSGPGIPKAAREKVFERFYRLPASKGDGCGLGLAIVRQVARQHGAEVKITRSPTLGGSAVEMRFPTSHG